MTRKLHACSELALVRFCKSTSAGSGLGVGILGLVMFSSGGVASSALGLRPFTFLSDRMFLRMSIRFSRPAVGIQLSLCALKATKYILTLINIAFG